MSLSLLWWRGGYGALHSESVEVRGHWWEVVLSFHHVGSEDPTLVIKLGTRRLYCLRHANDLNLNSVFLDDS